MRKHPNPRICRPTSIRPPPQCWRHALTCWLHVSFCFPRFPKSTPIAIRAAFERAATMPAPSGKDKSKNDPLRDPQGYPLSSPQDAAADSSCTYRCLHEKRTDGKIFEGFLTTGDIRGGAPKMRRGLGSPQLRKPPYAFGRGTPAASPRRRCPRPRSRSCHPPPASPGRCVGA